MSSQKERDINILLAVSGRRKAKLIEFYYKMYHGNENYSLSSSEKNSFKNTSSREIAEKIYNLGQSNPRRWRKIISGILTFLVGIGTLMSPEKLTKGQIVSNAGFVTLGTLFFGSSRLSEKTIKRKRKALLKKLTLKKLI